MLALAGFALLSVGDAVVKTMAGEWPPTAVAALRYALGAVGLAGLLLARQGRIAFTMPHPRVQLLRGAGVAMATVGFFSAIFVMPLASATAITFTSPMLTALLAAVFLGEPARRETWLATLVAFIGVLIVLRPNFAAAGWAALLPLVSAFGMSLLMIGNRFLAGKASPLTMQFLVAGLAAPLLLVAAFAGHMSGATRFAVSLPDWTVVARCALVAISASTAHWLVYLGTTRAGAATVAPMAYVQLLIATVLGWAFFGNQPDALTLLGGAIIVAAGLFLWRAGRMSQPAMTD
jgi:drug/metabolite transporter (DMT)-like permease